MKLKKIGTLLLITILGVSTLVGCSGTKKKTEKVDAKKDTKIELSRDKYDFWDENIGFAVKFPEFINKLKELEKIGGMVSSDGMFFQYGSEDLMNFYKSLDGLSEDEVNKKFAEINKYSPEVFAILREDSEGSIDDLKAKYSKIEELGEVDGIKYYLAYNEKYDNLKLTDTEKEDIDKVISVMDELKNNIEIYGNKLADQIKAEKDKEAKEFKMKEFTAKNLNGEDITLDYIKKNKLTMVNIWTTWCGPCVGEMSELAKLSKDMLPEGVKLLGICVDGGDETEVAKQILADANVEFDVIIPDESIENGLLKLADGYPTTLFIDSEGKLVGEKKVGAPFENVEGEYLNEINKRLEMLGE
ncbi:hypothetical protein SH2C18_28440 [Clostridium sediminicola]|uniref:TlpA disulfide reductase family protein n=1 Tax=Clostridium sediminicola TaxID=3114879 RepID=UPI0031F21E18